VEKVMKPWQVLIFVAAVIAVLGTLYQVIPDGKIWSTDRFADDIQVTETDTIAEFPVYAAETDSIVPEEPKIIVPKVVVDSTTDSRIFLASFYASLAQTGERKVRVLHYGDSQIEEDRISQQIREKLQARFGGKGVGLMPLAQTIPTLTVKQELRMNGRFVMPQQGPRRYLVYSFKRDQRADGLYGPMGQMAEMNDSLVEGSEVITAICKPIVSTALYERWQVFADTSVHYSFFGDTVQLNGRGKVYGLSQESRTGVIVDNIPMRGCLGIVFTKMDSAQLSTFYREQNVRLIILQYGGNAIPSNKNPGTIQAIVKGLRQQVQYLQTCAPDASILFIGPSDMLTQTDGEWTTYPMVPYMDKLLRKMALEENIAYFSLFRWMGGAGSMLRWQEVGLAGSDGVHFTRAGAKKAGNAIGEWILKGNDGNDGMME
jgi:lysophospholipase L1-like esterase